MTRDGVLKYYDQFNSKIHIKRVLLDTKKNSAKCAVFRLNSHVILSPMV